MGCIAKLKGEAAQQTGCAASNADISAFISVALARLAGKTCRCLASLSDLLDKLGHPLASFYIRAKLE